MNQIDPCILKLALKAVNENNGDKNYTKTASEFLQECILKSQFDIDLILGPFEDPTCKCVPHQNCNWSKKMIEDLLKLSRNNLVYNTGLRFFKNKVCDNSKRHVYCCTGGQPPSAGQVKKLKVIEPEDKMCSSIDGYTCASSTRCRATVISENNLASCPDVNITSIGMICCANKDILEPFSLQLFLV